MLYLIFPARLPQMVSRLMSQTLPPIILVDLATCPVCLHFLDAIQTEAEYAEASDGFVPGNAIDLGIRRLPCAHVICGKCARTWLQLVSDSPFVPIVRGEGVS